MSSDETFLSSFLISLLSLWFRPLIKFWYASTFVNESRLTALWKVQNSTTHLQVSWSSFRLGVIVVYMPGDVVVFVGDFAKLRQTTISFMVILGKWPTWRTVVFYMFISILYMFRATLCSSSWESILLMQPLVYVTLCRWLFRVQVGKSEVYQRLYWYNWFSWWWARGCSKHVENWNKYIEKNYASSWSFTKNHNEMYGQQNIKFSFMMSVSPFTCPYPWKKSAVTRRIFLKFGIWVFFENLSR